MYFKNLIRNKTIGTYIGLGALLLSITSLIFYLIYVATDSELLMMPWVIVFLSLSIAGEIVLIFFDNDYLPIALAVLPMLALGCFVASPLATLWSIASYINDGIVMEGANPDNFRIIITIAVLLLAASVAAVTAGFFKRIKISTSG